jgi:hypothetical protein
VKLRRTKKLMYVVFFNVNGIFDYEISDKIKLTE